MGCYSYFPVSDNDLSNVNKDNRLKITLKDKRELYVNSISDINLMDSSEVEICMSDSIKVTVLFSEIEKIRQEKFDFGKSCFTGFWITLCAGTVFILSLLLLTGSRRLGVG